MFKILGVVKGFFSFLNGILSFLDNRKREKGIRAQEKLKVELVKVKELKDALDVSRTSDADKLRWLRERYFDK